jgi:hypothetical protein
LAVNVGPQLRMAAKTMIMIFLVVLMFHSWFVCLLILLDANCRIRSLAGDFWFASISP